jgi:hypothetical protein
VDIEDMNDNDLPINRNLIKKYPAQEEKDDTINAKPIDEFASAFPKWDLLPPAILVKKVRRNI